MKETTAATERLYRNLLMRCSGEERVLMSGRMFDGARVLVRASLEAQGIATDSTEAKVALFLRLYGNDFDPDTRNRYALQLRQRAPVHPKAE